MVSMWFGPSVGNVFDVIGIVDQERRRLGDRFIRAYHILLALSEKTAIADEITKSHLTELVSLSKTVKRFVLPADSPPVYQIYAVAEKEVHLLGNVSLPFHPYQIV